MQPTGSIGCEIWHRIEESRSGKEIFKDYTYTTHDAFIYKSEKKDH